MKKLNLDKEKDAIDFVTDCMFSLDFLKEISNVIFSKNRDMVTVGHFYDQWLKTSGATEYKIPFNLGIILGYVYCGILFTKEHWFDLLPDADLASVDAKWGISGTACSDSKITNPGLTHVVRRIRNALGHGHVIVDVPKDLKSRTELFTRVVLTFHDKNIRDGSDTFEISLNLDQINKFIKAFQSVIHCYLRSKK